MVDSTITKNDNIRNFNNLDVIGSEGEQKQFIILVGKRTEGWNCCSLFGVALFRSPSSKTFVLQATMRCLRNERMLKESKDGIDTVIEKVNLYNDILTDVIIPKIFYSLNSVEKQITK